MYEKRRSEINKGRSKIRDNEELQEIIKVYLIEEKRAPDSISGREKVTVCTQTIYTFIDQWAPSLKKYLKYKKGYKKR
jgi:IS30 family transposase